MSNNRIYYAIQQVAIKGDGGAVYFPVRGLQSVTSTTNFNLEKVFQIGQLSLYENIEEMPDIQLTLNRVLDGNIPMYCLATMKATTPTLVERANQKCSTNLSIFAESNTSALGTPLGQMEASGLYVGTVGYTFPKDGNFTENITLQGNNKVWKNDSRIVNVSDSGWAASLSASGFFTGLDSPAAVNGVNRRQDLIFTTASGGVDANGAVTDPDCTILPSEIAGVGSNGVNNLTLDSRAHFNSIGVSVNLNRENLNELGRKAPYFRTPTFPVEVTTDIEITATSGEYISATESGIYNSVASACSADSGNLKNNTIRIATCEGLRIYCGMKNKLSSVNYNGGDAGGGPVNVSYTYQTYNDFTVLHSGEANLTGYAGSSNAAIASVATGFWATGRYVYLVN